MEAILISHLLGFLADPISGWDQKGSPQIALLLNQARIARHSRTLVVLGATPGHIKNRYTCLRRVTRALNPTVVERSLSKRTPTFGRSNPAAMNALNAVIGSGTSFSELVASWSDLAGKLNFRRINLDAALMGFTLNLPIKQEKPLPVSALEIAASTTSPEMVGTWKAFAEAKAPNSQAVIGMRRDRRPVTTPSAQALSGKRMSNAAVIREAKAKQDRRLQRTAIFDMSQMSWPQWEVLNPTIRSWVTSYRPELTSDEQWSILRPAYLRLMSLVVPVTTSRALNISSHLVLYLKWIAERRPEGLTSEVLALSDIGIREDVDSWIASMALGSKHSHASRRSDVRGVLNALYPESAPLRLPRQPSAGPYSNQEITEMRALARFQPGAIKSLHLSALIALCAGAGLTPGEAAHISPNDLVLIELGGEVRTYLVKVRGEKPRAIPLLLEYVDLMGEVIALHNEMGRSVTRKFLPTTTRSSAHRVVATTDTAEGSETDIQAYRLRATWLVTMMQAPIPLRELLHAAGLMSTRMLFDLIAYCDPVDQSRIQEILATAASRQVAE